MSAKKVGYPTKDFTDAGTGESFSKFAGGKPPEFETGAHANYLAAGLITETPPKAADKETPPAT